MLYITITINFFCKIHKLVNYKSRWLRRNWYLFIVLSEYIVSKQRFDFETANLQNISNLFFCNLCKQYLGRMSLKIITGDMNYLIVWKSFTIHRCNILPSVLKFLTSIFYNIILGMKTGKYSHISKEWHCLLLQDAKIAYYIFPSSDLWLCCCNNYNLFAYLQYYYLAH